MIYGMSKVYKIIRCIRYPIMGYPVEPVNRERRSYVEGPVDA
jgi:hypothetical protein